MHPSGLRPFTPRELACLQTFPVTHDFAGSVFQKKKQIGNAVPPVLAEALLKEVRKTLEKADRERSKKAGEDVGKRKRRGKGKGKGKGKREGKGGEKEKEREGWVTILQPLGGKKKEEEEEREREREEKEKEQRAAVNIPDDEECRATTILQSLRGKGEKELHTTINIPDGEEGRVTILQPPEEMELQTTINIPDEEEGKVTILQSLGGIMVMTVD